MVVSSLLTTPLPAEEPFTNSLGMRFVPIQPGSFVMGQDGPQADHQMLRHPEKFDDADSDEKPAHKVNISQPFQMAVMEVTLAQYRQFKPNHLDGKSFDTDAVTQVSWHDATAFCQWLSEKEGKAYRLPTEAEWEYACRAGTQTLFHTGDRLPDHFHKWSQDIGFRNRYFKDAPLPAEYQTQVARADILKTGRTSANAWGLQDMHGNVAEWCADWHRLYEATEQTDPQGPADGDFKVFRGGHHSIFTRVLRSANRGAWLPQASSDRIGFRLVLAPLPKGRIAPPAEVPLHAQNVSQSLAKIQAVSETEPMFEGPVPYVKIPEGSYGPLFFRHNHSPSITECPNGDLLSVWYSCANEDGAELSNVASRLRRGQKQWEPASVFWDGEDINDHGPKIWWDGEQTIYHFVRGLRENVIRTSKDNGATWSKALSIQPPGEFGNQVIRLSDGTLVISHDVRSVSLVYSQDEGKTWKFNDVGKQVSDFRPGGKGFRYPGIHAPLVQLKDGRIMAMSRNDPKEDQAKFGFKTPVSFTTDLGKSWTYEASPFPAISSVQRAAMIRLQDGGIAFFSFTDQWSDWKNRKGMSFKAAEGSEFTGYGLFAAVSWDEGKTWPVQRLITPGGKAREVNTIDRVRFTMSDTMAEPCGYLAAVQARNGAIHLITSKNHYTFNLAWLKALPTKPQ